VYSMVCPLNSLLSSGITYPSSAGDKAGLSTRASLGFSGAGESAASILTMVGGASSARGKMGGTGAFSAGPALLGGMLRVVLVGGTLEVVLVGAALVFAAAGWQGVHVWTQTEGDAHARALALLSSCPAGLAAGRCRKVHTCWGLGGQGDGLGGRQLVGLLSRQAGLAGRVGARRDDDEESLATLCRLAVCLQQAISMAGAGGRPALPLQCHLANAAGPLCSQQCMRFRHFLAQDPNR
jgi:hypothetical protein